MHVLEMGEALLCNEDMVHHISPSLSRGVRQGIQVSGVNVLGQVDEIF